MLYPSIKIGDDLSNLGVKPDDIIMLHGDAGVASQYIYEDYKDSIDGFFSELKSYLCDGAIFMPSFSYSATKGEVFDVHKTPSEVGLLSEKFRLSHGIQRSQHPIFSICAFGKHSHDFINTRLDDCFGEGTFFDLLYNNNIKIVTLGCPLERVTFAHYIEQKMNVSYRSFKNFTAIVLNSETENNFDVRYFVRDTKLNTRLNLNLFENEALKQEKILIKPFGRFKARSISAKNFFQVASNLICENEYALIEEK